MIVETLMTLYFVGFGYTMDYHFAERHEGRHTWEVWGAAAAAEEREMGLYRDARGEWQFKVNVEAVEESRAALALRDVKVGQAVEAYGIPGLYHGRAGRGMALVKFPEGVSQVMAEDLKILK